MLNFSVLKVNASLPPCPDRSWLRAYNWPAPEGPLQGTGGEDPQDTEEGAGQDPGSWPRDTPPQHSQEELIKGVRDPDNRRNMYSHIW